jgi:hypothetical protein
VKFKTGDESWIYHRKIEKRSSATLVALDQKPQVRKKKPIRAKTYD